MNLIIVVQDEHWYLRQQNCSGRYILHREHTQALALGFTDFDEGAKGLWIACRDWEYVFRRGGWGCWFWEIVEGVEV